MDSEVLEGTDLNERRRCKFSVKLETFSVSPLNATAATAGVKCKMYAEIRSGYHAYQDQASTSCTAISLQAYGCVKNSFAIKKDGNVLFWNQ